ncbi:MAG: 6-phosphofructokinase [Oscillospiraceae bacterium]|nr:6-phosphofructokinase [Oscillospiraceae bacterium]MBQ4544946.1 6-phosphofructokinase [Oscillospiraceae bacterium]MBQ6901482.1 6-phosphofructokinase [Oscillospiraceae bacterium]
MSDIKTIGVLTSGGDAPGMNAAIRAVARTAAFHGITCLGIRRGYNGLINGDVVELNARSVNGIISKGGTMLFTARCPEFMTEEGIQKAANTCKYLGIDGIVTIGGDGTFRGARELAARGVHTIGVPATIDNDIASTQYSIGFDTACNTALDAIDKLRDTMQSHERCSVVEVMGHNAGHLALNVAIACGAQAVLVPEKPFDFERDVVEKIRAGRINKRSHYIIIQAEGVGDSIDITNRIIEETGIDTRLTILGHIQRGGSPTARDRVMASRFGEYAVRTLMSGKTNRVVCSIDNDICDIDINEALQMKKDLTEDMYTTSKIMSI